MSYDEGPSLDIEKAIRKFSEATTFNFHKNMAVANLQTRIINSPLARINLENSYTQTMSNLRKEFDSIKIGVSVSDFTPEQIEEFVSFALKTFWKESAKSVGKILMYPFSKIASFFIPSSSRRAIGTALETSDYKFGQQYYKNLLELNDLATRAPKEVQILPRSAQLTVSSLFSKYKCEGGFNLYNNTISFTKEFTALPKSLQANLVSHELKHFEQIDNVIRTFGIDRYIQALKANMFKVYRNSSQYENMSDDAIKELIEQDWTAQNLAGSIKKAFANSIDAEKISANSNLGQEAKIYLNAIENYSPAYKKVNMFMSEISEDYRKNPLEIEAYKTGKDNAIYTQILELLQI